MNDPRIPIRIGMIDPCQMTLAGCKALAADHDISFVMSATNGRDGFRALMEEHPDVLLSEIDLRYRSIFDVIGDLRQREIDTKYILYSEAAPDVFVGQALRTGVSGYLTKDETLDDVVQAIRNVMDGKYAFSEGIASRLTFDTANGRPVPTFEDPLSQLGDRQLEAVRHLARGKTVRATADLMGVAFKSVTSHRDRAYRRLGIKGVVSLSRLAIREGLINPNR